MPVESTTDAQGRRQLRLKTGVSAGKRALAGVVTFLVLFLFGPALFGLGTLRVSVRCERPGGVVRCEVKEGALWGLVGVTRHAEDVREVMLITQDGRDKSPDTRVALSTATGEVPVVTLSSDRNAKEKEALVSALRIFLANPEAPQVVAREDLVNLFAWLGGFCSLLWLLMVGSLLALPRYALRPQVLTLDAAARRLELRERPGSPRVVTAGFDDVRALEVTMNEGGLLGALTESANTDEAGRRTKAAAATPPLHLALHLKSGERLVFVNSVRLEDEAVRALAKDVAATLGVPLPPEPKPAPE